MDSGQLELQQTDSILESCVQSVGHMDIDFVDLVSTAFDAHVTDQTLTGSRGDRSATRRQLCELAAAPRSRLHRR